MKTLREFLSESTGVRKLDSAITKAHGASENAFNRSHEAHLDPTWKAHNAAADSHATASMAHSAVAHDVPAGEHFDHIRNAHSAAAAAHSALADSHLQHSTNLMD